MHAQIGNSPAQNNRLAAEIHEAISAVFARHGMLAENHGTANPSPVPVPYFVPIPEAVRLGGISRRTIYRLADAGRIILRKNGHRVLVDTRSLRRAVAALPPQ